VKRNAHLQFSLRRRISAVPVRCNLPSAVLKFAVAQALNTLFIYREAADAPGDALEAHASFVQ